MEFINERMGHFQGIIHGEIIDATVTKDEAQEYLNDYKENLETDITKEIENLTRLYGGWLENYYEWSGGLADKITENVVSSINSESLGLKNLSYDPKKYMEALENAASKVKEMAAK